MADYVFAYRLGSAPTGTNDGSGMVFWDIWAVYKEVGNGDWVPVPGRHKTIQTPASNLSTVNDMATGGAKTTAMKQLLTTNLNTTGVPITGWTEVQLEALMDNNDSAALEASRADAYITVDLGLSYPVHFNI